MSCLLFYLVLGCSQDEIASSSQTAGSIESVQTFGGSNNDRGESVIATTDGGFAILGYTQSSDGDILDKTDDSFDYWILKFNRDNALEWRRTYGGSGDDRGRSLIQTIDGGYALIGTSNSTDGEVSGNSGFQDFWLVKLDASGSIEFQKSFGFQGNDTGISLIQTKDQGYLLAGILDVTASGGEGNTGRSFNRHAGGDYWIIKLNAIGNFEWSRYFGGNFTDTPEGILQLEDESYIIAGGSDSNDTDISSNIGSYDFWIIRITANGDLLWERSFGGTEIDEANGLSQTSDGHILVVGDTRSRDVNVTSNKGAADIWAVKLSISGELLWEKNYGGSGFDASRAISKTRDNGFVIAGSSRSSDGDVSENKGQNDLWVIKIDSEGRLVWEQIVGGSNIDFGYGITQLQNGTIVVTGDTTSSDGDIATLKGFSDLLIVTIKD